MAGSQQCPYISSLVIKRSLRKNLTISSTGSAERKLHSYMYWRSTGYLIIHYLQKESRKGYYIRGLWQIVHYMKCNIETLLLPSAAQRSPIMFYFCVFFNFCMSSIVSLHFAALPHKLGRYHDIIEYRDINLDTISISDGFGFNRNIDISRYIN